MTTKVNTSIGKSRGHQSPPRVIHIVESLGRGAIENWLVRMLRHANRREIPLDWTFYCTKGSPADLDQEAIALGARVVYSPCDVDQPWRFMAALRAELRSGSYQVIHSHYDITSAIHLVASIGVGVGRKIVHVHNADEHVPVRSEIRRALYRALFRRLILALADRIVGISQHTLDTFLLHRPRRPGRDVVHYYGVDPAPFLGPMRRTEMRANIGLPQDALILLFGGRIVPEKNPTFAVDVLAALRCREPRAVAVFAGAGAEEGKVKARAVALGVTDAIRFLGWRNDLPEVMGASDWFILPRPEHPKEGLGLAVVEAQLAGLRLLISMGILDDPLLPRVVFRRLPLQLGPERWAQAALDLLDERPSTSLEAADTLHASRFDLDRALDELSTLHG